VLFVQSLPLVNWLISKLVKRCIISCLICSSGLALLCRQINSVVAATARSTTASGHKQNARVSLRLESKNRQINVLPSSNFIVRLRKNRGKTVQIVGLFLQHSFFSNFSLFFLFLHCRFPSYPAGEIKYNV